MLDVHPPHAAAHTWRDFFIHIATIVVGLCIAVCLEQTVEFVHHRNEVAEAREALRLERAENQARFDKLGGFWRWETAALQNNLLVLQYLRQHPGAPQQTLPGVLYWGHRGLSHVHSAWDGAQSTGVAALMPGDEVARTAELYRALDDVGAANSDGWLAISEARRYALVDADPSHLSPAQVSEEISLTRDALSKHLLFGVALQNLRATFPDFPPTVTLEELAQVLHAPDAHTQELLAHADALTKERLKAAGWEPYTIGPPEPRRAAGH